MCDVVNIIQVTFTSHDILSWYLFYPGLIRLHKGIKKSPSQQKLEHVITGLADER